MQEDLENAKEKIREEMKQEFLNLLAQRKEGTMNMSTPLNDDSIQVAPTIQEEEETGEQENENEDALQQLGSVVTVQKEPPTRSSKTTARLTRSLFSENTENVATQKTYITPQQLMNRTRNQNKRSK